MDYRNCRSLPAMFFEAARLRGDHPFLWRKQRHSYQALSWSDTSDAVMRCAAGLLALGIERGDRVALIAENRPEWVIADLAIMSVGGITVPTYITNTTEDHRHILSNSGARAAIVSTAELARRLLPAAAQTPSVEAIVAMQSLPDTSSIRLYSWQALLATDSNPEVEQRLAMLTRDDAACLIYTSGTGGAPKGVILSHGNIIRNCESAYQLLSVLGLDDETFLSFLPLSHSYEHTAGLMFPISIGAQIYFADGAETLPHDMLLARPTLMTAVPRLYEVMYQRIRLGVQRQRRVQRLLFEQAVAIGRKRLRGERLTYGERLIDPILDRFVRATVRARFGGRLKAMISGGAPLNPEIGSLFVALGVRLLQGYGQTEAAPVICCNPPYGIRIDTVGPAVDGVTLRIAEDGEILVSGDNVMQGYWNDPEETARTLVEGWLHTGDIGQLNADGFLTITDRKRDFIKNSGGDMVSPARVEGALTLAPEIVQAIVFGDRRPYLVAVLVPDPDFAAAYAKSRGLPAELERLAGDNDFHKSLSDVVARVNRDLAIAERVRRFIIAAEPFSVANAQLTPTLKIRRHAVRQAYQPALEMLYDGRRTGGVADAG